MSDYLSEEEQLERLRSWWQENGISLVIGVVVVIGGFVGWQWYQSSSQAAAEAASDLYAEFEAARGDERDALLGRLATEAPGSSYHALALFSEAAELVEASDLEAAAALYQQVLDDPSDRLVADLARLRLATTLQGLDRGEEALAELSAIQSEGYRRAALEMKGDIHQARGEIAEAHTAYRQALDEAGEGQAALLKLKVVNTERVVEAAVETPVEDAEPVTEAEVMEEAKATEDAVEPAASASDETVDTASEPVASEGDGE